MAGTDTARGMGYQHAQSVMTALDVVGDPHLGSLMVEGTEDIMDIAVFDHAGHVVVAKQIKTKDHAYTWSQGELFQVLGKWAALDAAATARFEFVTDGRLGRTGERVRAALVAAADGDLAPVASLLNLPETDALCQVMARCVIRQDEVGVGLVLAAAEREIRTLQSFGPGDATERSSSAVDRLFTEISVRAGSPIPDGRVLTEEQILALVDGTAAVEVADRWGASLRSEYLAAVCGVPAEPVIEPALETPKDPGNPSFASALPATRLLDSGKYVTLTGQTGTGKSTTTRFLRRASAMSGQVVIITHAEAYVAGRLDSLVSAAMSAAVHRDLPSLSGAQVLNDDTVTIVIDGVSEVPPSVREALAAQLRPRSASETGARIVLAGRDVLRCTSVLAASVTATNLHVKPFDDDQCRAVAAEALAGTALDPSLAVLKAEHALGDMVTNPMLLTMAVRLIADGTDFQDRAGLYDGVINQMANRTSTPDVSVVVAALGVTYAGLLDEDRRYATTFEWIRRVNDACETLTNNTGVAAHRDAILSAAEATGLVTKLGDSDVRVPVHDSFADYLAGVAHGQGLAELPAGLTASDEQRILFAGEHSGATAQIAAAVTRDLPFVAVAYARTDHRPNGPDAPQEVAALLRALAPATAANTGVRMWKHQARIVASIAENQPTAWVDELIGTKLLESAPTSIVERPNGPLATAVRLWSLYLDAQLRDTTPPGPRPPTPDVHTAAAVVEDRIKAKAAITESILTSAFSPEAAANLRDRIGPLGIRAIIYPDSHPGMAHDYTVLYRSADRIEVRPAAADEIAQIRAGGSLAFLSGYGSMTGVSSLLNGTAGSDAAKSIRKAANQAANTDWF